MSRFLFFFQAEDGIRDIGVTGVQTCALPISSRTGKLTRVPEPTTALMPPAARPAAATATISQPVMRTSRRGSHAAPRTRRGGDRKGVVSGKSVDLGGRGIINKKNTVRLDAYR